MPSVLDIIENKGVNLDSTEYYAAILGESPSKGARSPLLWNAAFEGLNISGIMHPMDVLPENLERAVQCLREEKCFIGGAITMPYKIDIIPFLDETEPEAESIGAVNCLYRKGDKIIGTNTDGAGALWSLEKALGSSMEGKRVFQIGTGGAGFAVAAYIASAIGKNGKLMLANRTAASRKEIGGRLKDVCKVEQVNEWPVTSGSASDIDVVINCSSIGFETLKKDDRGVFSLKRYMPFGDLDDIRVEDGDNAEQEYMNKAASIIEENNQQSTKVLKSMNKPFVFDIIYQPEKTTLLEKAEELGCKVLNGKKMNLEQAVIAFVKATSSAGLYESDNNAVRKIMSSI